MSRPKQRRKAGVVLALIGQKGGIGKSNAAICLAAEAAIRKMRALLIDADPQGTAVAWGRLATGGSQNSRPTVCSMGAELSYRVDALRADYDFIVLDTPGRLGETMRAALMVADLAILPCSPAPEDIWALYGQEGQTQASTADLVEEARKTRPNLVAYVLLSNLDARTSLARRARRTIAQGGLRVLRSSLSKRVAYQSAKTHGMGVTEYAPTDAAASEVRKLFNELMRVRP